MYRPVRTAVAAAAAESTKRQIVRALAGADVELLDMATDGMCALAALRAHRADLLVTDAQLPGTEGTALARRALGPARLPVRPRILVLYDACFALPERSALAEVGVGFVEKPVSCAAFAAAVRALEVTLPRFAPQERGRAEALLDELGVPAHIGRDCLRAAVLLCAADERLPFNLGRLLYPMAGEICGLSAAQAERAMRHVIGLAWQSDQFDNQYRIFADTVDAGRGQPTCGEMICRLAYILRLEG